MWQVFNPPYVPTPDEEVQCQGISQAWAGGFQGRQVTDKILPKVSLWSSIMRDELPPLSVFLEYFEFVNELDLTLQSNSADLIQGGVPSQSHHTLCYSSLQCIRVQRGMGFPRTSRLEGFIKILACRHGFL